MRRASVMSREVKHMNAEGLILIAVLLVIAAVAVQLLGGVVGWIIAVIAVLAALYFALKPALANRRRAR